MSSCLVWRRTVVCDWGFNLRLLISRLTFFFHFSSFYFTGESTIATLRENLECLEAVTALLDKETPGSKNWLHFAKKFGIATEKCDYLKPKGIPSPTKQLMEYIVQVNPDCTLAQFIQALVKMQRHDVVNALKQFFSGKVFWQHVRYKKSHSFIKAKLLFL